MIPTEKDLIIHTNRYDVIVDKAKILAMDIGLDRYNRFFERTLPNHDCQNLQSIYCYRDGVVRYTFFDPIQREKSVLEEKWKIHLEERINQLIDHYFKKEN